MLVLNRSQISVSGQSRILYVNADGSEEFKSIQDAVKNAGSGDTVFVYRGVYNESVGIDRSVFLVGEDRDSTVINGQNTNFVVSMMTDGISISGFTIKSGLENVVGAGIRMVSSRNTLSNCRVEDTYLGVYLQYSTDNVISDNEIAGNDANGISLYFSSRNVFSGNSISGNSEGLYIFSSNNNTFSDNVISKNREGISLTYSGNNVFSGNTFMDNQDGGSIFYCNHNYFYHNNFLDAIKLESSSANIWNLGAEGNYWHDYTDQDVDHDGVGNRLYIIDANNRDNNPLMGMFSGFDVVLANNTYRITIISNSTVSDVRFEIGAETGNRILRFNVSGQGMTTGFSRVSIPTELMNYSLIVFGGQEEIVPTVLSISSSANVFLYFTYPQSSKTVAIISSQILDLYSDLLKKNADLQGELSGLNASYLWLLGNYTTFLDGYEQLLQDYQALNASYYQHITAYQESLQNFRNLTFMFEALTAVFIVTTVYLSKRLHVRSPKTV
jgi:parallel beta-helix repeat protein